MDADEAAAKAKADAEKAAREKWLSSLPVYMLKGGEEIKAAQVVTTEDSYVIKDPSGKFKTVKKDDVAEIRKP